MPSYSKGRTLGSVLLVAGILGAFGGVAAVAGSRPLELTDLMKLRTIHDPVLSRDGAWVAYALEPDRGDGRAVVRSIGSGAVYFIDRGSGPAISSDSRWVAALVEPTLEEQERARHEKKAGKGKNGQPEGPETGLALLATADGSLVSFEKVKSFAFSEDGHWMAYQRFPEKQEAKGGEAAPAAAEAAAAAGTAPEAAPDSPAKPKAEARLGATLVLRQLADGREIEIPHAEGYAFDHASSYLAYAVAAPEGEGNGVFARALAEEGTPEVAIAGATRGRYTALAWPERGPSRLAFAAAVDDEEGHPGHAAVWTWDGESREAKLMAGADEAPEGWFVPSAEELSWSRDGERLFFGFKPLDEEVPKEGAAAGDEAAPFDPYDVDAILADREVDVWHWNDPLIVPQQKKQWDKEKDRVYRAVYHVASGRVVPLAGRVMRNVAPVDNPKAALGFADVPYLKRITWDGFYQDVYRVSLEDGSRQRVAEGLRTSPFDPAVSLSPGGRFVVYYQEPHWYLFDGDTGRTRNLTEGLPVSFANEDHDYPSPAPGYGVGGWVGGDAAVLLYDKYDIWQFPTGEAAGPPIELTAGEGRKGAYVFRVLELDPERDFLRPGEELLLAAYNERRKNRGFYRARVGAPGVSRLLEGDERLTFLTKAKDASRLLFTRETYTEFPDLWVAGTSLEGPRKLSDANPEIADYAWGEAELVHWRSDDGIPLDGVLIKPGNYEPGKRYPVLVYFYRFFSQRLYEFNEPVVNHRPSFPVYASHGYAIFLPDIRFEIGRPGLSAVKCLVPGVQKLIDMGIADPDRIGLHGHSWSGYQTAFVVTQTNLFRAAVAGAPVSNMTSSYGGIRWESGLARQFQYEKSQSRIGGSLWEARDLYIENSPLFYADRIRTPLLIEFGDQDGAVPWYQGIELYLALRRLGKEAVFLEYRGEGHHPKKYANKLDYAIKMKQFFDHYLKGDPAPDWLAKGVPYRGK